MRNAPYLCAFLPLLLAPESPTFGVESGTEVTKSFGKLLHLELDSMEVTVNGEEEDTGELPEVVIDEEFEAVFVDKYVRVEDGRSQELVRTFETLSNVSTQSSPDMEGEMAEEVSEGESELDGTSVRFRWNSDEEEYVVSWADDEDADSSELFDGLDADADYLYLLPEEDVEVGDSWDLDVAVFDLLSSPGGDLAIYSEGDDPEDDFGDQFNDGLEGSMEATLTSIEDGVATITISGEVTTSVEQDGKPEEAPAELELMQTFDFNFEIEGVLVWDMNAGHAKSLELEGDVNLDMTQDQSMNEFEVQVVQSFTGGLSINATFE